MTRASKVLVVMIALGSLGIAAFAAALVTGGPNWEAIAQSPEISKFVSISRTDTGQYTGTMRVSGEQVGSSANLADVVIKSQQKVLSDLRARVTELQPKVEQLTTASAAVVETVEKDKAGLEAHAALWSKQLQALSDEIARLTAELSQKASQNTQIQQELGERRFEVLRLHNQLELLRDDLFAAETQRNALQRELLLLEESRKRLEHRKKQLKGQLGEPYEEPAQ
jgi:chromosome segregation ATPase